MNRAQHYGEGFESYKKWLNENIVIIAQIEHIDAIENLDEILAVKGIDGSIIGPYDLSGSMGYPGDYNRPDVKDALQSYKTKVNGANKPLGYHVIESDASFSIEKIQQGYSLIALVLISFSLAIEPNQNLKN